VEACNSIIRANGLQSASSQILAKVVERLARQPSFTPDDVMTTYICVYVLAGLEGEV